ncbi:class I SAM-dependent methyltransferase [uncultured Methanolobus sp.]|uniref:class I SAM-dependent methyltransferase n=1 Tax=uncultured Methanolobus sp. TaxID=218300 RepID=UPI002AAA7726|nr:class I SAM-dependent methyltransferase [uncultured Methanolobus sp.]
MRNAAQEWVDILSESTYFRFFKDKKTTHDQYWRDFAVYDDYITHSCYPGAVLSRISELIIPEAKIIDIGAGTGAFSIALAENASHVIAVDPSSYHLDVVSAKCTAQDIENIVQINAEWKDVDSDTHTKALKDADYALAAYSIIDPDIENFLQKMHDTASKGIFIVYRAGERDSLDRFAYGDKRSIDYQYMLRVMENMGMDVHTEFFNRNYKLPFSLVLHLYRNSERTESELREFLLENERFDNSSGENHVTFSSTDALLYVLKNNS